MNKMTLMRSVPNQCHMPCKLYAKGDAKSNFPLQGSTVFLTFHLRGDTLNVLRLSLPKTSGNTSTSTRETRHTFRRREIAAKTTNTKYPDLPWTCNCPKCVIYTCIHTNKTLFQELTPHNKGSCKKPLPHVT